MKKKSSITAAVLAAAVMVLSGCSPAGNGHTPPELPGVPWGSTTDQALESLGTDREKLGEKLVVDDEETGSAVAILENEEVFGQKSEGLLLFLGATKDGKGALTRAEVYYPDDADMKKVAQEMEKAFGQPAESMTLYNVKGEKQELASGEESKYWQGKLLQNALSGQQKMDLRQYVAHHGSDVGEKIDDNQWQAYLKNPMVTASWYTNYQNPLTEQAQENPGFKEYRNVVILDGSMEVVVESLS